MTREPSWQGVRRRQAVTRRDGTWPLPEEIERELREASSERAVSGLMEAVRPPAPSLEPRVSGPVEALRQPAPAPARESTAAPAFPRPPRPARPPGLAPALQKVWNEVLERHDSLGDHDLFALLGVPYESGSAAVLQAFSHHITRFHPDKLPTELELLRPYAMRIVARLNEARMTLSTRHTREAYLRSLGRPVPAPSSRPPATSGETRPVARVVLGKERRPAPGFGPVWKAAREESVPLRPHDEEPPKPGGRVLRAARRDRPSSG